MTEFVTDPKTGAKVEVVRDEEGEITGFMIPRSWKRAIEALARRTDEERDS